MQHDFVALAAVVLIDDTDAVWNEQAFAPRGTAAQCNQQHVARGGLHNNIGWNSSQGAWGDPGILSTEKVETYGASGGIGR